MLEVADGETITITEEGTYILTGTASECTVLVNAADAKVQFVLDGVTITNTSEPAIYVLDADKCFVTSAEGSENVLLVSSSFATDTENGVNTDAVIFSKADLTLNGTGSLNGGTLTVNGEEVTELTNQMMGGGMGHGGMNQGGMGPGFGQ